MADEVVSHGFHPEHSRRLAAYWAEALGGPMTYSDSYGDETSVVRMHSGNGPHEEMDRRAIACFDQALTDVGLADDERVGAENSVTGSDLGVQPTPGLPSTAGMGMICHRGVPADLPDDAPCAGLARSPGPI